MALATGELGSVLLGATDRAHALATIKGAMRIERIDDDAMIVGLGETALGLAEQFVGKVMIVRTIRSVVAPSPGWQRLASAPVQSITQVDAIAQDGVVVGLLPTAYAIDIDARGDGWVRIINPGSAARIVVTLTAGLAESWPLLPAALRQGVVLLAGYLYNAQGSALPPPAAITALWRPFRGLALGQPVIA